MSYAHGCYSIYHLNLPYSHIPLHSMAHLSLNQYKCTHIIINGTCLSGLYPVPFTHKAHDYPHFNIYIPFGGPKYCITALNTYVIPLLHHILATQFIHTYVNITEKSPPKSPKHKNILFFNNNT
ncbi:BDC_1c_G0027860.mRNA.1.CDS.1 [Saccharomyces cerevisiae]|nr:BDF_1d_G0027810.mRNA.1.CDS.1 [Saccharomyces cerevisiae]CAI4403569.1 BDC_1c_G0027860.mRNA.1.CDS.1 [Saccharomyces cerevisiae]CAI7096705.1 BDF_1d_G0027810.mRNA.1.CDS.1 [Saccharomyces cerevisiae]CAI7097306.1 BDC_1c_G0027860.mRNA.1.CDS.1 [Saccharomyces cerevisiae]